MRSVTDNPFSPWTEPGLTWNNQPGVGGPVGSSGRLSAGTFVDIPIPAAGIANGVLNLGLTSPSTTATTLASREAGANAPLLIVTTSGAGGGDTTPPSTPTGLSATATSANRVDLSWAAATDNVGVTGYELLRDGVVLAGVGAVTAFSDTSVVPATGYSYQVRARDQAGNRSGLSGPATVTTPPAAGELVLTPTDDAYVAQASATTNFGGATTMQVDNSPVKHLLMRFDLSGAGGRPILRAVLRLNVVDSSGNGGDFSRTVTTTWSQGSVTWNTAPTVDTSAAPVSKGTVTAGTTTEVDVTSLVNGPVLSLRAGSPSSNGADYSSKEGAVAPRLVLTLG